MALLRDAVRRGDRSAVLTLGEPRLVASHPPSSTNVSGLPQSKMPPIFPVSPMQGSGSAGLGAIGPAQPDPTKITLWLAHFAWLRQQWAGVLTDRSLPAAARSAAHRALNTVDMLHTQVQSELELLGSVSAGTAHTIPGALEAASQAFRNFMAGYVEQTQSPAQVQPQPLPPAQLDVTSYENMQAAALSHSAEGSARAAQPPSALHAAAEARFARVSIPLRVRAVQRAAQPVSFAPEPASQPAPTAPSTPVRQYTTWSAMSTPASSFVAPPSFRLDIFRSAGDGPASAAALEATSPERKLGAMPHGGAAPLSLPMTAGHRLHPRLASSHAPMLPASTTAAHSFKPTQSASTPKSPAATPGGTLRTQAILPPVRPAEPMAPSPSPAQRLPSRRAPCSIPQQPVLTSASTSPRSGTASPEASSFARVLAEASPV